MAKLKLQKVSHERLRQVVFYNPETGVFTWLLNTRQTKAGAVAGRPREDGYIRISIDRVRYMAHVLAWFYMTGVWPTDEIDHKDCSTGNNVFTNLREASHSQNMANRRVRNQNKTGLKGASWDASRKKWIVCVTTKGVKHWVGRFDTPEEAHHAYGVAAKRINGEFARLT